MGDFLVQRDAGVVWQGDTGHDPVDIAVAKFDEQPFIQRGTGFLALKAVIQIDGRLAPKSIGVARFLGTRIDIAADRAVFLADQPEIGGSYGFDSMAILVDRYGLFFEVYDRFFGLAIEVGA